MFGIGATWSDPSAGFGSWSKLGQTESTAGQLSQDGQSSVKPSQLRSTAGQLSQDGQTWSTVASQDPECHRCTLANSCSWNDTTESQGKLCTGITRC
ncbi:hypothetical protein Hdeb2414_s0029g00705191 [Helianthus debilis subsp. tardiflorus]